MKTYKGIFYFPSRESAESYARKNGFPLNRIIAYGRGYAIQTKVSGPYVGPELIRERANWELFAGYLPESLRF